MNKKQLFLFLLVTSFSAESLLDLFKKPVSIIYDVEIKVLNNYFVSDVVKVSSNAIADAANFITSIPLEITRLVNDVRLPKFPRSKSVTKFINEFNFGLDNEDVNLRIDELIKKYGYILEEHTVVTEDGYVLKLFRIPSTTNGSIVFLMHGLLSSADDYVSAGPESGLAYLLAEQGYDVWLGNARGNKYSRSHLHLCPSDGKFWDFSWHEIGYYDLPAMIDYTLSKSRSKTLQYIGHSQGTTSFFVMTSERPEYNRKVSLMVAMAPIALMNNMKSPFIRLLVPGQTILEAVSRAIGVHEFLPDNNFMRIIKKVLCGTVPLAEVICNNLLFLVCGFDFAQMNVMNLPVIFSHSPSGSSVKQLIHYGQGVISGEFKQYDYGETGNLERYGTEEPPVYNVSRITVPISFLYSENDWMAATSDVERFASRISSIVDMHKIPYNSFNHLDFLWAKDFKILIYKRIKYLLTGSQFDTCNVIGL